MYKRQCQAVAAWNRWLEFVEACSHKRESLTRAISFMRNAQLSQAMSGWYEKTQYLLEVREKISHCLLRLENATLSASFDGWCASAQRSAQLRRILLSATEAWSSNVLRSSFTGWSEYAVRSQKVKCMLQKWLNKALVESINKWVSAKDEAILFREHLEKAVKFWLNRELHKSFLRLAEYAETKKKVRQAGGHWFMGSLSKSCLLYTSPSPRD